jgi:hypothetical protein
MKLASTAALGLLLAFLGTNSLTGQDQLPKNAPYKPVAGRRPGIATGPSYGSLIRLGEDLAQLCSDTRYGQVDGLPPGNPIGLDVFATRGGFDSLHRLVNDDDVHLAIVPADAWLFAQLYGEGKLTPSGNVSASLANVMSRQQAEDYMKRVSVIVPLTQEVVHIVVRSEDIGREADGKLTDLHSLFKLGRNGKKPRTSIGLIGDSSWVTAQLLATLTGPNQADWGLRSLTYDDLTGLEKLSGSTLGAGGDDAVDAVILVGSPPHPALRGFNVPKGWFDKGLTFLPVVAGPDAARRREAIAKVYPFTELKTEHYGELLRGKPPVSALSVTALLAGIDLSMKENKPRLQTNRAEMATWAEAVVYLMFRNLNLPTLDRTLEQQNNSFGFHWQAWQQVHPKAAATLRDKSQALGLPVREYPESSRMRKMVQWWEGQRR